MRRIHAWPRLSARRPLARRSPSHPTLSHRSRGTSLRRRTTRACSDVVRTLETKEWRRVARLVTALPCERFNDEDAIVYGRLRAGLESRGYTIGPYDLLIAAQALRLNAVVVTHNTAEFQRVPGLKVEDWQTP